MWQRLAFKWQFTLILLLPAFIILFQTYNQFNDALETNNKLTDNLIVFSKIEDLSVIISAIQKERIQTLKYLYNRSKQNQQEVYAARLQNTKAFEKFIKDYNDDNERVDIIFNDLKEIRSGADNGSLNSKDVAYLISALNDRLTEYTTQSFLVTAHDGLNQEYENQMQTIQLKRLFGRVRGLVYVFLNEKENNNSNALRSLNTQISNYEIIKKGLVINQHSQLINEILKYDSTTTSNFFNDATTVLLSKKILSADEWWNSSHDVFYKYQQFESNATEDLRRKSVDIIKFQKRSFAIYAAIVLLVLGITVFLLAFFIKSINKAFRQIGSAASHISEGNPDTFITVRGSKELLDLNNSMRKIVNSFKSIINFTQEISQGKYGYLLKENGSGDVLNSSLNKMSTNLKTLNDESAERTWIDEGIFNVNEQILHAKTLNNFIDIISQKTCEYTQSSQACFYLVETENDDPILNLAGGFCLSSKTPQKIVWGEGMIGQTAISNKQVVLNNLPTDYAVIETSLGQTHLFNIIITPIRYQNKVVAIFEMASVNAFTEKDKKLLEALSFNIGAALEVFVKNEKMAQLVEHLNAKNEELSAQEEELKQTNSELENQALLLQQSEEELIAQQKELELTNVSLEEKAQMLEEKNEEVQQAKVGIELKAQELEAANKYKSEFLANMSHELRTPLNSILILADLLKENKKQNLEQRQVDQLTTIGNSGRDLLELINDILDLSKIEAGKVDVELREVAISEIKTSIHNLFEQVAIKKKINFEINQSSDFPNTLITDSLRVQQIVKNLLSNAFKFTNETGTVTLAFELLKNKEILRTEELKQLPNHQIAVIKVTDSGIGISKEKVETVFEAFKQEDGSTSRKYGGTGLGLSISKQLVHLLSGEMGLESEQGKGSTFFVYLPLNLKPNTKQNESKTEDNTPTATKEADYIISSPSQNKNIDDDRNNISISKPTVLIIEDDEQFANVLKEQAHENLFNVILANNGDDGISCATFYNPDAIILDMKMPGKSGWDVYKILKSKKATANIPIHIISGVNKEELGFDVGEIEYLQKPVSAQQLKTTFSALQLKIGKAFKKLLIVEDDEHLNNAIKDMVLQLHPNAECIQANSLQTATDKISTLHFDAAIVDIGLPDSKKINGIKHLKQNSKNSTIFTIIYTGKELSNAENAELQQYANTIVVKSGDSFERLKDELNLFMNMVQNKSNGTVNGKEKPIVQHEKLLKGKKVLLVDDDIRNIYALSGVLEQYDIHIVTAMNGKEAIDALEKERNVHLVLMDIMMPEMDGYEAMEHIRRQQKWKNLPILALTAKAMKGDKEKCIAAGANDYVTKPIDIETLISSMSVWLYN